MTPVPTHDRQTQTAATSRAVQGHAADGRARTLEGATLEMGLMFRSSQDAFGELVAQSAQKAMTGLEAASTQGAPLAKILEAFGAALTDLYSSESFLGLYRTVLVESPGAQALARAFYDAGPGRAIALLANVLQASRIGRFQRLADCQAAADHFIGLLRDTILFPLVLKAGPPSREANLRAVSLAVRILLDTPASAAPLGVES